MLTNHPLTQSKRQAHNGILMSQGGHCEEDGHLIRLDDGREAPPAKRDEVLGSTVNAPSAEVDDGCEIIPAPGNDGSEPPRNKVVLIADNSDENDTGSDVAALAKRDATGKAYSETEARLIAEMARAAAGAKKSQGKLDENLFIIGRNASHLVTLRWNLKRIGQLIEYSVPSVSQLCSTFKCFPTEESRCGQSFSLCQEARKVYSRLSQSERDRVSPTDILKKMANKGLSVRQASSFYQREAVEHSKKLAEIKYLKALTADPTLKGRCYNDDCLKVLRGMAPKSIKLLNVDPPYASYLKEDHEGYVSGREGTNGLRTDCENNEARSAVPLSCEVFRASRPQMRDDGCMIYWSAGNTCDRPEVILAAREAGWECRFAGYWKKSLTQPGNFSWPFSTCVERFLMFYPISAEPFDHSQCLSRSDVITPDDLDEIGSFASPSQRANGDFMAGRKSPGEVHMYEKPVSLMRFFIEKTTSPGDLVVDAFGCSGNCCIAAIQANRPYVYIELNDCNYRWGVSRIAEAEHMLSNLLPPSA